MYSLYPYLIKRLSDSPTLAYVIGVFFLLTSVPEITLWTMSVAAGDTGGIFPVFSVFFLIIGLGLVGSST